MINRGVCLCQSSSDISQIRDLQAELEELKKQRRTLQEQVSRETLETSRTFMFDYNEEESFLIPVFLLCLFWMKLLYGDLLLMFVLSSRPALIMCSFWSRPRCPAASSVNRRLGSVTWKINWSSREDRSRDLR